MFFDWLTIEQDFGYQLPILGEVLISAFSLKQGRPVH
ncbi:Uncharacterised protein [Salmonella enterica subsp. enterica]|uniref:Uncharacterized protein n=1 Tax=Salmonella enterica I TaxID=59201 RepID=A0A379UQQ7_SALET|nr:Uncharacterised protein [Salmonella enterica subsp. enterica]